MSTASLPLAVLAFLTVGMALGSCSPPAGSPGPDAGTAQPATILTVAAEHGADRRDHALRWSLSDPGAKVDIEVATDPSAAPGEGQLIGDDILATDFVWTADDTKRRYFIVTPEGGKPIRVAPRVLPLEGGRNFRDLGGYPAADGKTVKWGRLFRSGVMAQLTSTDYDYLSGLGIKTVCDLRTAEERQAEPTQWNAGAIAYVTFPDPPRGVEAGGALDILRKPGVTPDDVRAAMTNSYAIIAQDQAPAYRVMFDRLAAGEMPLAFNCSAGKDRTGVGAALLLTALGAPREVVREDYALSDKIVDYMQVFASDQKQPQSATEGQGNAANEGPYAFLRKMPPELIAPLMKSDPAYLDAALASMEASHGSVLAYIKDELDVTDAELAAIRAALLE